MSRFLYSLLWYLLLPLVLLRLWRRSRSAPEYGRNIGQRFGKLAPQQGRPLWIHAVSVGETVAIAPLVELLLSRHPEIPLLLTHMTATGAARAEALFGDRVMHSFCPYDLPHAMQRFIRRVKPRGLVVVETELWPNMLAACAAAQVPVLLANARLSARSARGYARFGGLTRNMLQQLAQVAAQHETDGQRLVALGLPDAALSVIGSIKFDLAIPQGLMEQADALKHQWGGQRPVLVAGSTHEGEEQILLSLYQQLQQHYPALLLILVPRHPERFDPVAQQINTAGLTCSRRSLQQPAMADTQVYLADTMGELMLFYQAADMVFVGGSLVARGGHNPLEPAALGKPVLMGPHCFNFQSIVDTLAGAGGLVQVEDQTALHTQVADWLSAPEQAQQVGQAAEHYVAANRGALERLYALVEKHCLRDQS
ncbi:lipid IV(A) 3-deoxy-D-manno-octulosonic acid transferase [Pontibacter sp. JAM-7]|uniref:lipid IV(A) 3-deoxy-D-manno-octulosonic acid transferase n=1 Tax=Pontibacter sp. JAM-7 TaxID=3366581 RepID=UPI003AF7E2C2